MMIHNRDNVPSAYSNKSRDYQVLLKLFDVVSNSLKLDIESLSSLLNPESCPNHMLPLLASYLEYDYDYNETYESNRIVMRHYPKLLRHKGSEIGIKSAMILSCDISNENIPNLDEIIADYDYENATIYIYYPSYLNKVRDLIEVVRPAGMRIVLLTYDRVKAIEVAKIYDDLLIINNEEYIGSLSENEFYILDDDQKFIIGIGSDSRSVISDDYKKGKFVVLPSKQYIATDNGNKIDTFNKDSLTEIIDNNNYLSSIKSTSQEFLNKETSGVEPELIDGGTVDNINQRITNQSRIGFSEISGIRLEGDD